jgi:hypothetical protein
MTVPFSIKSVSETVLTNNNAFGRTETVAAFHGLAESTEKLLPTAGIPTQPN